MLKKILSGRVVGGGARGPYLAHGLEGTSGPLLRAKFHPIGATCRPCGAKNLKIGLWVN